MQLISYFPTKFMTHYRLLVRLTKLNANKQGSNLTKWAISILNLLLFCIKEWWDEQQKRTRTHVRCCTYTQLPPTSTVKPCRPLCRPFRQHRSTTSDTATYVTLLYAESYSMFPEAITMNHNKIWHTQVWSEVNCVTTKRHRCTI